MSSYIKAALVDFIQSGGPPEAVALAAFKHEFRISELKSYIAVTCWYYGGLIIQGSRDVIRFFFSDGCEFKSLPDLYEAFAVGHLPVSLETFQRSDGYRFPNFESTEYSRTEVPNSLPSILHWQMKVRGAFSRSSIFQINKTSVQCVNNLPPHTLSGPGPNLYRPLCQLENFDGFVTFVTFL